MKAHIQDLRMCIQARAVKNLQMLRTFLKIEIDKPTVQDMYLSRCDPFDIRVLVQTTVSIPLNKTLQS